MRETLRKIVYAPLALFPKDIPYRDKVAHATIGTLIYMSLVFFIPMLYTLAIVAVIAFGKEMLDKYVINGTPDIYDFLATIAIPTVVTILYYALTI